MKAVRPCAARAWLAMRRRRAGGPLALPIHSPPSFQFLDTGPLVDGELELTPPRPQWIDAVLQSAHHPLTIVHSPRESRVTREGLEQFLTAAPGGLDAGNPGRDGSPTYSFLMLLRHAPDQPYAPPVVRIAGGISLRLAPTERIERYYGHFGYHVYPPCRGWRYAARAVRLLLPLARRHGLRTLWITCNPDNLASRRTCECVGATLVDTISIPPTEALHAQGETAKCRYRIDL